MIEAEPTCKDFGDRPGCLGTPDPRYAMDFSDIGEGQISWPTWVVAALCRRAARSMKRRIEAAEEQQRLLQEAGV